MQGPGGADVHAGRVFTVQTGNGNVFSLAQRYDLDPPAARVADLMVVKGTDQFAHPATAADIFRILTVFKISYPLSNHFILLKQNITDSLYPCP
jgi:hypothetical protein